MPGFALTALVCFVAIEHAAFFALEAAFWTRPLGLRVFRQSLAQAQASAPLAANQGLYNGFLAAGLVWSLLHPDPAVARQLQVFFFACVTIAGAVGAATVSRSILFVQALPGALGLALATAA